MTSAPPAVGERLPTVTVHAVSADKIRIVALLLRDPNPIHYDIDAVRTAGLGDREVNQGGATMAYLCNLLTNWVGERGVIRALDCRFLANVLAGDDVVTDGVVTAIRAGCDGYEVDVDVRAECRDVAVIKGTATVLLSS